MPTRKPGFGSGNRLVTRFGRTDDADNDTAYRIGANNLNKKRFPAAGPSEVAQINNVTRFFQTPIVSPNTASLGWELQSGGFSVIIESPDTGGGPPDFTNVNVVTDWVIPRPPVAVYHARWNQTGGGGSADGSSTAENVWVPLSGGLIINMDEEFDSSYQIVALVEISDDAGVGVLDSAVVDLTLQIDP